MPSNFIYQINFRSTFLSLLLVYVRVVCVQACTRVGVHACAFAFRGMRLM